MGRIEEREAKIKMECRSEKAGTSKGSTASGEGGERRKRQEMEERAVDQRPLARRRIEASDDAGEQSSDDGRRAGQEGESRMGRRKEVPRHGPETRHTGSTQMAGSLGASMEGFLNGHFLL
jgi:hypothetical protein